MQVDGAIFFASYPIRSSDLSEATLKVLSLFGSKDGLATPEEIKAAAEYTIHLGKQGKE